MYSGGNCAFTWYFRERHLVLPQLQHVLDVESGYYQNLFHQSQISMIELVYNVTTTAPVNHTIPQPQKNVSYHKLAGKATSRPFQLAPVIINYAHLCTLQILRPVSEKLDTEHCFETVDSARRLFLHRTACIS